MKKGKVAGVSLGAEYLLKDSIASKGVADHLIKKGDSRLWKAQSIFGAMESHLYFICTCFVL